MAVSSPLKLEDMLPIYIDTHTQNTLQTNEILLYSKLVLLNVNQKGRRYSKIEGGKLRQMPLQVKKKATGEAGNNNGLT